MAVVSQGVVEPSGVLRIITVVSWGCELIPLFQIKFSVVFGLVTLVHKFDFRFACKLNRPTCKYSSYQSRNDMVLHILESPYVLYTHYDQEYETPMNAFRVKALPVLPFSMKTEEDLVSETLRLISARQSRKCTK